MEQLFVIQPRWLMWAMQAFFGGGTVKLVIAARRAYRNRRLDPIVRSGLRNLFLLYLAVALFVLFGPNPIMEIVVGERQVRVQYARGAMVLAPGDVQQVREIEVTSKSGRGVRLEIVTAAGKAHRTVSIRRSDLPVVAGAMADALDLTRVTDDNRGLRTWWHRGTPAQ